MSSSNGVEYSSYVVGAGFVALRRSKIAAIFFLFLLERAAAGEPVARGDQQAQRNASAGRQHRQQEAYVHTEDFDLETLCPGAEQGTRAVQQRAATDELTCEAEREQGECDADAYANASVQCTGKPGGWRD